MSQKTMNPRDLEKLSAYLDDALKPTERTRLEARLTTDPALRAALAGLRETRAVLRATPKARAPRNFTLTPAMVGHVARRRFSLVGSMRYMSAMASFLFVILFASDLWFSGAQLSGTAEPEIMLYEEDTMFQVSEAVPAEESAAAADGEVYTEKDSEAPLPAAPSVEAANAAVDETGAEEGAESEAEDSNAVVASEPSDGAGANEATESAEVVSDTAEEGGEDAGAEVMTEKDLEETETPSSGSKVLSVAETLTPEARSIDLSAEAEIEPAQGMEVSWLRWLAYGMAVVALATGLLAWQLRRV